ncbi:hypothetical protein VTJ04DRAFT_10237 [Mycothermus thermophilus]|uniref:uncharacterized protein n=1 Tax=Humicola insolens TaxID=85995 RepID=UPI0037437681
MWPAVSNRRNLEIRNQSGVAAMREAGGGSRQANLRPDRQGSGACSRGPPLRPQTTQPSLFIDFFANKEVAGQRTLFDGGHLHARAGCSLLDLDQINLHLERRDAEIGVRRQPRNSQPATPTSWIRFKLRELFAVLKHDDRDVTAYFKRSSTRPDRAERHLDDLSVTGTNLQDITALSHRLRTS